MPTTLAALTSALAAATGADSNIDRAVAAVFGPGETPADYSASVPPCVALLHRVLPSWRWHVGWGAGGLFPYASLSHPPDARVSAEAPTVPLALLRAIVKAAAGEHDTPAPPRPRPVWQRAE